MSALSDYLENKWDEHLLKNTAYTKPTTLYLGLFTADPGESGVTNELALGTGAYARAAITNNNVNFPQCAVSGTPTKTNATVFQFPTATLAWGSITHWAIYDDDGSPAGNMLLHGAFAVTRYVAAGDAPKVAAGAVSFTITNATSGGPTAYTQRKLLDHTFGGPDFTPPATVYLGLGTALSGESLTEWDTDSGYARQAAAFDAASGGIIVNADSEVFTTNILAGPYTLNSFGVWDDPTAGNLLITGPVTTSRTVNTGDVASIPDGGFTLTAQ